MEDKFGGMVGVSDLTRPLRGTVFVVQEVPGRNILSAEKFGDLELLLPEGSQLVLSTGPTVKRLNYNKQPQMLLVQLHHKW